MTIWPVASTTRPEVPSAPGAPIATILSPATPMSAAAVALGITATPPVMIRSSMASPPVSDPKGSTEPIVNPDNCPSAFHREGRSREPSDDALVAESTDFVRRIAGERGQYLLSVFAQQWRRRRRKRRVRQAQRRADHRIGAARRMLEVEDCAAFAQMRVGEHFGGIEQGAARDALLREGLHDFALVVPPRPAFDDFGQRRRITGSRLRLGKAFVGQQIRTPDDLRYGLEHFGIVGRNDQIDAVIRTAALAADQIRVASRRRPIAAAGERLSGGEGRGELHPRQVQDGLLHRHLNELAVAGTAALHQCPENGDREVHAGARIPDIGAVDERRPVGFAGDAHGPRGGLCHRFETFEPAIGAVGAKAFDRGINGAGIEFPYRLIVEPQPLHDLGSEVLGDDVGLLYKTSRDFLALLGLQIDDSAALAAVKKQEEIAVDIRVIAVPQAASAVAVGRALDLDHVCAEPGEYLGARWTGLVVGEVDDANTV